MIAVNAAHKAIHHETDLLRRAVKDSRKRLQTLAEQIDAASSRLAELTEGISVLTDKLGGLTPPTAETARSTESDGTSLSFWQAMVARDPQNALACHRLSEAFRTAGRIEEADHFLKIAFDLAPTSPSVAWDYLGTHVGQDVNSRIRFARDMLDRHPGTAHYSEILGFALFEAGRYVDARDAFIDAVDSARNRRDVLERLAKCNLALGDDDQAVMHAKQARSISRKAQAYHFLGRIEFRVGQTEAALASLELALTTEPPDDSASDTIDRIRTVLAMPQIEAAATEGPQDAAAWFQLGDARWMTGDVNGAREAFARARALEPGIVERKWQETVSIPPLHAVIIGPARTGTSRLRNLLAGSGQVAVPSGEPEQFPFLWLMGFADFCRFFQDEKMKAGGLGDTLTLAKNPTYFSMGDEGIALIATLFPELRIISLIRDPVERDWSEIRHAGYLDQVDAIGRGCEVPAWLETVMEHSDYSRHLNRWLRHFPRGHLHLVDFASLDADPEGEMNKVLDFLRDAPPSKISPPSVALARVLMAKREQRETMPIHVRQFLSSRYPGWSFEAVASTISAD